MNKNQNIIYFIISLIISFGIPFLILHLRFLDNLSNKEFIPYLLGFGMILVSLLNWFFLNNIGRTNAKLDSNYTIHSTTLNNVLDEFEYLKSDLKGISENRIYSLSRDSIYDYMKRSITKAESEIDLMYFGKKPPKAYLKAAHKDSYIDSLSNIIINSNKRVRRVILYTNENKGWIKTLVDKFEGNDNFTLAILYNTNDLPIISVQVFDNNKAILMNFDKSTHSKVGRDLVIKSESLMNIFNVYYDQVFQKAHTVLLNGTKKSKVYSKLS